MSERRTKLLVGSAVWLSFLSVSLVSTPIPGVNESYYLTKAKHVWDVNWCERDLLLQSFPAHQVFYVTFGGLTRWWDLFVVALLGRVLSTGLLAVSWTLLVGRLAPDRARFAWSVLVSAWLFLGLQAIGNLSGEWLIGGFESKVVAYALAFASFIAMWDRRLKLAALSSGLAVSFHPVVGIWHVLALCFAELWCAWRDRAREPRPTLTTILSAMAVFLVAAAPGLWPALRMLRGGDPLVNFAANYIQVLYRLKHHLDPLDFGVWNYLGYAVLAVVWRMLLKWPHREAATDHAVEDLRPQRWWSAYVIAAGLFAASGLVIGLGSRAEPAPQSWTLGRVIGAYSGQAMPGLSWRVSLLKFYPFRLFDLVLPMAVSLALVRGARNISTSSVVTPLAVLGLGWALIAGRVFPPPHPWDAATRTDWAAACQWIARETPANSLCLTPVESDTFKWLAQRAEFVNFKDCPQDAAGVVEWNRRLKLLNRWGAESYADDQRYSASELGDLRFRTGIDFVVTRRPVTYDATLVFQNRTFKIFRLPEQVEPRRPSVEGSRQ